MHTAVIRFRTDDILSKHAVFLAETHTPEGYEDSYSTFNQILAFSNSKSAVTIPEDWKPGPKPLAGFFGYDLKNRFEKLQSNGENLTGFPEMAFFEPQGWFENEAFLIEDRFARPIPSSIRLIPRFNKEEYIRVFGELQKHLRFGDIYEVTFAMEFYSAPVFLDPFSLYVKLTEASPMPFSCFLKWGNSYLMCASPERFLAGREDTIISQPMKGTAARYGAEHDEKTKRNLVESEKERSENIMIVDLVRNDLAKCAVPGSVKVDELCGVYPFPGVFQLISSISCQKRKDRTHADLIKAAFPPGSMTGAPKIRAMEIIEQYENASRGIFSGAVGYLLPNGDFDLNVVIRSLFYNADTGVLSFKVGGAITLLSDAEEEYEECLLKASAIARILGVDLHRL